MSENKRHKILHLTSMFPTNIDGIHSGGHAVYHTVENVAGIIGPGRQDVVLFNSFLMPYWGLWDGTKKDAKDLLRRPWKDYLEYKKLYILPYKIDRGLTNLLWQELWPVARLKNDDYALVHIHTGWWLGRYGLRLARQLRVPVIVTARQDVPAYPKLSPFRRRMIEMAVRGADAVIAPSAVIAGCVRQFFGRDSVLIPNGADSLFDIPAPREGDRRRCSILFAGVLEPRKCVMQLMDACSALKARFPLLKLYIAGTGPQLRAVKERAEAEPAFEYLGLLSQEELRAWMDKCEILCVPSNFETFGIVYAEAMKRGMAVVARKGVGIDGMGVDGRDYMLIENDEDLPGCLGTLFGDPHKIASLAMHGRELAKPWSWENNARLHAELYSNHGLVG